MRVVSLLPSATDTVVALGLTNLLVGRSHECDAKGVSALPALTSSRVGNIPVAEIDAVMSASLAALHELQQLGPQLAVPLLEFGLSVYQLHLGRLLELRPDVVLTCMQRAHGSEMGDDLLAAALQTALGYEPKVVHCAAETLEAAWADMQAIADALGVGARGQQLVWAQRQRLAAAADTCRGRGSLRVCCLQWPHPLMAAGGWVSEMIAMAGSQDVFGSVESGAAHVLTPEQLGAAAPDALVFALCGLSLDQTERSARTAAERLQEAGVWDTLPAVRSARVAVVDGNIVFSRAGPCLGASMEVLVEILHPEAQRCHEGSLWRPLVLQPRAAAAARQAPALAGAGV